MRKEVLLIAHFTNDFDESGNNRFNYLAELMNSNNINVELVTSNYSHNKKRLRNKKATINLPYKLTILNEPMYSKNISLKRIYSHYRLAMNLKKYLEKRNKPDLIYCAVPSIEVALKAAKYAKKNKIKFIIDIQDLWPEAFKMAVNIPLISKMFFYPLKRKSDYIYEAADEIVAVSETYINRALLNNKKTNGYSVYLGTDLNYFDQLVEQAKLEIKQQSHFLIAYIGTLGNSYDLFTVIDSLQLLKKRGIKNIKFIIMGDGPLMTDFQAYANDRDIDAEFLGRLSYPNMVKILSKCDIAVNPIRKGSAASIINKVGDYAAAGLPVINTQENIEYRRILNEYNAGFNIDIRNKNEMANKIFELYSDKNLRAQMGRNSRRLAKEKFDRSQTYNEIIDLILK